MRRSCTAWRNRLPPGTDPSFPLSRATTWSALSFLSARGFSVTHIRPALPPPDPPAEGGLVVVEDPLKGLLAGGEHPAVLFLFLPLEQPGAHHRSGREGDDH